MKKYLAWIGAFSLIPTTLANVTACSREVEDSWAKAHLQDLMEQARTLVRNYRGSKNEERFIQLKLDLEKAEQCYYFPRFMEQEQLDQAHNLLMSIREFKHPGYKMARDKLIQLLKDVERKVNDRDEWRNPSDSWGELIPHLLEAIREAKEVLENEEDPLILKLYRQKLDYYYRQYSSIVKFKS